MALQKMMARPFRCCSSRKSCASFSAGRQLSFACSSLVATSSFREKSTTLMGLRKVMAFMSVSIVLPSLSGLCCLSLFAFSSRAIWGNMSVALNKKVWR